MFSVHTTPEKFDNGGYTLKTRKMISVHTTPEKFDNGGYTHQMFSVHTTPEKFENAAITGHFGFVFEENSGRKKEMIIVALSFSKSSVLKAFSVHTRALGRRFQIPPV